MTTDKFTVCDECIHRVVCEAEADGDCENFQSALEETAKIEYVSKGVVRGGDKCPKCGHCQNPVHTIVQRTPYCSKCGKRLDDYFQNYCPNCGRKIVK